MTSIKLKFRSSLQSGREGVLYYQIIHERVIRQIKTQYKLFPDEWDKDKSEVIISSLQTQRVNYVSTIKSLVKRDIKKINMQIIHLSQKDKPYCVDDVISAFEKDSEGKTLFEFMKKTIIQLKDMNKIRTSETYSVTLNNFMGFRKGVDVFIDEIDSDLMLRYESYLKDNCLSMNTISFYMRILRATYNRAVEKDIVTQCYPFKHVYTGTEKTVKRAISLKTIKQIKELDLSHSSSLALARDMFMFSFYTRGMSFVDIAYLKNKNLSNGILTYRRRKTNKKLYIKWEKCMQDIVDKYANHSTEYLLSIIKNPNQDARRQYQTALDNVNLKLKQITEIISLSTPLTMYVARHSWANIAKSKNISISVISEGMGHSSELTTQIYLSSLDTSIIDKANMLILKSV